MAKSPPNAPLKEGATPVEFLKNWGRAFRDCFEYSSQRRQPIAAEHQKLMQVCADAVWTYEGKQRRFFTLEALSAELSAWAHRFQTEVIEQGGNIYEAQRRINLIQSIITDLTAEKVAVVQMALFA